MAIIYFLSFSINVNNSNPSGWTDRALVPFSQACERFTAQSSESKMHDRIRLSFANLLVYAVELYLGDTSVGIGVTRGMVAESRQTGQDEVDGTNLQSHAAEQHTVVGSQWSAAEQCSQDVEWQSGQHVGWWGL